MEFLQNLLDSTQWPVLSALLLGLMTAISPCPLATNITAIGFISKQLGNKNKVFVSGLFYTLGRVVSYSALGILIWLGASQFTIARFFQGWGEKVLGPVLIFIGLVMLDIIRLKIPGISGISERMERRGRNNYWSAFLLGVLFALAFCPYSGVLYFGMLMPLTLASAKGLLLPPVFAIATGFPVIVFAWLIAYTLNSVGSLYNRIKVFEKWFRRVVAFLFISAGTYYVFLFFVQPYLMA